MKVFTRLCSIMYRPVRLPRYWAELVLVGLMTTGLILRLGPFIHRDLWQDELFSVMYASKDYSVVYQILHPLDDRPPLFYLFVRAQLLISSNKFFLRAPSLISSMFVIWLLYFMLQKENKLTALTVAGMAAFSPFLIQYSWQVRDYGPLLALTAVVIYLYYQQMSKITRGKPVRWREVALLTFLTLAASLLNYSYFVYGLLLLLVITVLGFFFFQEQRKLFLDYCKKLYLLRLPVYSVVIQYLLIQRSVIQETTSWIPEFSWQALIGFLTTVGGLTFAFDAILPTDPYLYVKQLIFLGVLAVVGLILFWKNRHKLPKVLEMLTIVSTVVFFTNILVMTALGSIVDTSFFLPNTFVSSAVLFLVGGGVVLSEIIRYLAQRWWTLLVVGSLIGAAAVGSFSTSYLERYPFVIGDSRVEAYQSYTEAMEILHRIMTDQTQLVVLPFNMQDLIMEYYLPQEVGRKDVLASYLMTKAVNPDVPINHVRPFVRMQKIVVVSTALMFDDLSAERYYSDTYLKENKEVRSDVLQICGGELKMVARTSQHVIEQCDVFLRSGQ